MSVESCPRKRAASQSPSAPRQQHSTAAPRQQHQRLTLPSGRPTHYAVFDCQTRPRGCADDALFLSYRRYYMLHDLMKDSVEMKLCQEEEGDPEYPWNLTFCLYDRWYDAEEDVEYDPVDMCFKTEEGRTKFEALFDLCCMLPQTWITNRDNAWQLAGFFHRRPHVNLDLMRLTYAFNDWKNPKWHPKLTEGVIKQIVGGSNPDGYRKWADHCESHGGCVDDIADVKDLDNPKKLKAAMLEALLDELEKLPATLIREDNEHSVDSLAEARTWESLETLAYAIKSSYAHVSNRGTPYHLKKYVEIVRFGGRDSVRTVGYERASTRSKKTGESDTIYSGAFKDKEVVISLHDILKACKTGIMYYNADVLPYSPKANPDMDKTFNLFSDYQHVYSPEHVIDAKLVNMWVDHIKNIICNGDPVASEYLLNWFAHIMQFPHIKTQTIPLIKSRQGAGKNFIFNVFSRYVLTPNMASVINDMERATGRFNALNLDKTVILLDEAMGSGNRRMAQIMKNLSTEEKSLIERKGQKSFLASNFINYIVATNNDFSSVIEESDRRYVAMEASDKRDLSGFDRRQIPTTKYKRELKVKQSNHAVRYLLHRREQWLEVGFTEEVKEGSIETYGKYKEWAAWVDPSTSVKGEQVLGSMLNKLGFTLNKGDKISGRTIKRRTFSVALIELHLEPYIIFDETDNEAD
ncbi:hypothetical protein PF002_g16683 [Phytophthora fragariae]|uniref:NrS-1 polymerase-like helicase domain-containing protein n=1 Tax=Phytophthora fragariae TaxID=53985 RepID=A0A6A4CYZ7_9STRA|nr:hypothetical protein PF006_g21348 [Phytophthora fragariae]KAE9198001.1 hypothetical protein PF004_g19674 [Phytophthora fragariae]KAE9217838.1 hypothetical protein PF002_g16683 [Phytophthora fragariae]KAE9296309.1 hypothetical protein PF001_g16927 [Phytophthora fragariae]